MFVHRMEICKIRDRAEGEKLGFALQGCFVVHMRGKLGFLRPAPEKVPQRRPAV